MQIFEKLILKVHNLAPNMCLTIKYIYNFFDIFVKLAIDWKFGLSIDGTTHHPLHAFYDKMAAQTVSDLESVIFSLPSLLCEMERHRLSDNIDMCGFFARRGEDFLGLLRLCS